MKFLVMVIAMFVLLPLQQAAAKNQNEVVIESASQFQALCKKISLRYFRKQKRWPYNWSASTYRDLNDYITNGVWKIERQKAEVSCRIRKGRKAKYTKLKILDD
ncbi:MAG: hypothetical protein OEW97_00150 [Gammaproteobacteria bacterium]|nr:hypothetical protein [Gammaproteobacteria bacterium]